MSNFQKSITFFAVATAVAGLSLTVATPADARKGKDVYIEDYHFKKPTHGYSGHSGAFYCDYQRLPKRKCRIVNGVEKCKIVGWTLRQMCQ